MLRPREVAVDVDVAGAHAIILRTTGAVRCGGAAVVAIGCATVVAIWRVVPIVANDKVVLGSALDCSVEQRAVRIPRHGGVMAS